VSKKILPWIAVLSFFLGYLAASYRSTATLTSPQFEPASNTHNIDKIATNTSPPFANQKKNPSRAIEKHDTLEKKISVLEDKLHSAESKIKTLLAQNEITPNDQSPLHPEKKGEKQSVVSREAAEAALPKPFSNFFAGKTGKQAELFNRFADEKENYDWAYVMEININNFISSHTSGHQIKLESVDCKAVSCQIMGFETVGSQPWLAIMNDMQSENWWSFKHSNSSSSSSRSQDQYYFYTLVTQ
jgi:hypothetical protein